MNTAFAIFLSRILSRRPRLRAAKQFAADGRGKETEEPLDTWFDVAVFAETDKPLEEVTPLHSAKHRLR